MTILERISAVVRVLGVFVPTCKAEKEAVREARDLLQHVDDVVRQAGGEGKLEEYTVVYDHDGHPVELEATVVVHRSLRAVDACMASIGHVVQHQPDMRTISRFR